MINGQMVLGKHCGPKKIFDECSGNLKKYEFASLCASRKYSQSLSSQGAHLRCFFSAPTSATFDLARFFRILLQRSSPQFQEGDPLLDRLSLCTTWPVVLHEIEQCTWSSQLYGQPSWLPVPRWWWRQGSRRRPRRFLRSFPRPKYSRA